MDPTNVAWVPVIDVSRNQGAIDFNVMRRRGVLGVIMRIAHGMTVDALVGDYYRDALAAGYQADDIGFYSFINPKRGSGPDTARFALDKILEVRGDLDCFYMIDVEDYKDQSPNAGIALTYDKMFADYLRQHLATVEVESPETRRIGYTNKAYWNGRISKFSLKRWVGDDQLAGEIDWIVARFPVNSPAGYVAKPLPEHPSQWDEWAFKVAPDGPYPPNGADGWRGWQISAGYNLQGRPYGASSDSLDLNIIYPEAWIRWTRQSPLPPPQPPPIGDEIMPHVLFDLGDVKTTLFGMADKPGGLVTVVYWSGPGNDEWAARRALMVEFGAEERRASAGNFKHAYLEGPLPPTMEPEHFANADEIRERYAPVVGHDEVARQAVEFIRAEINSLADREDSMAERIEHFERFVAMIRSAAGG